jgi:protein-disulfide isomerase
MDRRVFLTGMAGLVGAAPGLVRAQTPATQTERAIGKPDAKVTVIEFFSLTCGHCANFARVSLPRIKTELVETGKLRLVYFDYPLDQLALTAAMVARHLPPERYEAFVLALLASQDRWAFNRSANPTEELWKIAALAGLSRPGFDAALGDTGLRDWILRQAQDAQQKWRIDATPSFVVNGQKHSGDSSFETFRKLVTD